MRRKATAEKGRGYHKQHAGTVASAVGPLRGDTAAIGLSKTRLPEPSGLSRTFPF